jgi:hypothetical protein
VLRPPEESYNTSIPASQEKSFAAICRRGEQKRGTHVVDGVAYERGIRAAALAGEAELGRFQNEAEAVARLDHPSYTAAIATIATNGSTTHGSAFLFASSSARW